MRRRGLWILAGFAASGFCAEPQSPHHNTFLYAKRLLPTVVSLVEKIGLGSALERKPPLYVAVATGSEEYVYQLKDKIFIRAIKDRYEAPAWRICGDFAVVRVELMDASMNTLPPIMVWYMVYRDDRWERLLKDEEGRFVRENFDVAEIPPYATRCFELAPGGVLR